MARSTLFWIFLLFVGCSLPACAGEVKPTVVTKATVPNREEDYQLSITSIPREEVLPGQEINYTIFYGCSGGNETSELKLIVTWNLPAGEVVKYIPKSASEAYGDVIPDVELSENKISWRMRNFPARTTSQKVFFKLKAESQFGQAGTFPVEIQARLIAVPITKEVLSVLRVTYPEERAAEVPLLIWRYLKEVFRGPEFRFVVGQSSLLLLVLIATLFFLNFLMRKDLGIALFPALLVFLGRWLLGVVGLRRKSPVWGAVYSLDSNEPVFLARVSVYDFSGRRLGVELTNRRGEFGFWLAAKSYLIEVRRPGFAIRSASRDCLVLNETRIIFTWREKEQEIFLRKERFLGVFWERFSEAAAGELLDFLLVLGTIFGCLNFYFYPSLPNATLVSLYFLFLFFWFFVAAIRG